MRVQIEDLELGQFIPVQYHFNMLNDRARMDSFQQAIDEAVAPGAVVLELGGGTGVLSHFAAQKASRVYCVERNPELVAVARQALAQNHHGERVQVVQADAFEYLPPEPVDVVVCEMLHTGQLREKQMLVIEAFKTRYREAFAEAPMPKFVPEACIQAVQPLQQDFVFSGYHAPVVLFQDPVCEQPRSTELAAPVCFQQFFYDEDMPLDCHCDLELTLSHAGQFNALRLITKNLLTVLPDHATVDWFSQYMVIPLAQPFDAEAGARFKVSFGYAPGASIEAMTRSLQVRCLTPQLLRSPAVAIDVSAG